MLSLLAVSALPTSVHAAPFANGSFEEPVIFDPYLTISPPGTIGPWRVTAGDVDLQTTWATPKDGRQSVDMSGFVGGGLCQTFDTRTGATYDVAFWISHNAVALASASLAVVVNGVRFGPFTHDRPSDNQDPQWERHTLVFMAPDISSELCFESTDPPVGSPPDGAAMLDNVTVLDREPATADVALAKSDSPDPVRVGQALTYTLTATNRGPSTATGVTLTDTLPAGVGFGSAVTSRGTCNPSGGTVTCDLGSLASGAAATVQIVVTPTVPGPLTNTSTATAEQHDSDDGNNRAEAHTAVDPAPFANGSFEEPVIFDPYLTISPPGTIGPWRVTAGDVDLVFGSAKAHDGRQSVDMAGFVGGALCQTFATTTGTTYDVSFRMSHNAVTRGSAELEVVVDGVRFGPFRHDRPSDNENPQWERHALAFTAPGTSSELCFVSTDPPVDTFDTGGALLDTVTVTSDMADLALAKADSPDPVRIGQPLTYTLTVTNDGPSTATGVTVTDALPAGVTFGSVVPSQGSCTQFGGTASCAFGSLASDANATVTIVVTPTVTGPLTNTATITGDQDDPDRGDNTANQTTTVDPVADLALAKSDSPDPARIGQPLTYLLTVTNHGPSATTGVTLIDTLPARVAFGSVDPSQGSCSESAGTVICALGTLASGASATVTTVVTPTIAGPLTNSATVRGDAHDPDDENSGATEDTTVEARICRREISVGETIECSIDAPGEVDEFLFTTTATTRVLLRLSSAELDPEVRAFGPTGAQSCAAARSTPGLIDHQCVLSAAGQYSIRVRDSGGDETGGYRLHLQRLSNPAGASNCTAIEYAQTQPGSIDERLQTACFALTTTEASTRVLLRLSSTEIDPEVRVFAPSGAQVCGAVRGKPGLVDHQCVLSAPGPHSIIVDDRGGDETGGFELHVQRLNNPTGAPNCTPIDYGQTVPGSIDEPLETDCFSLTTTAASVYALLRLSSSEIDPEVRVFGPTGGHVCAATRSTPGLVDHQCLLSAPGPHSIIVDDLGGDAIGEFELHVQRLSNPAGASNCTPIDFAQTLPGSIEDRLQTACFGLTTTVASTRVLLRLRSTEIDPVVRLFDPTGGRLCSAGRSTPGLVELQCTLGASGPHSIIVDDRLGDETGGFELHVQRLNNPAGASDCTAIDYAQTLPGSIDEPLQTACLGLTTTEPSTRVLLRLSSPQIDPEVRVFGPTGAQLCAAARSTPGLIDHQCALSAAGAHSIIIDDRGGDDTGGLDLHVQRLSNPVGASNCSAIDDGQTSIDQPLETDCFSLTTTAASTPALLRLSSPEIDPELRVFAPTGVQLCATSRSSPGLVELQCTLGVAGPHSIIVDDRGGDETGRYELQPANGPDTQCSDGQDNDGDGRIDHPADPGCQSPADDSESPDCRPRFTPGGWTNGEWAIEKFPASIPEAPFEVRIDGASIGITKLLAFANRAGDTDRVPQVLVIASSGYLRLKPGADPDPPLPFGQSLVLGPAIYSTSTLFFNPQLQHVDIDTRQLGEDCRGSLLIRIRANGQGLPPESSTKTNAIMDLAWEITVPEPTAVETRIDVTGTFAFTKAVTLNETRTREFQSFRLYQISSMFIDSNRHDVDAFRYHDSSGEVHVSYDPGQAGRLLPPIPTAMDPQRPVLDSLHMDDAGIPNGNTPSYRITLGTTTGPIGPPTTPRAFFNASQNVNDDNLGLWVHQWPRPPDDRMIEAGIAGSISYEVRATADPLPPF